MYKIRGSDGKEYGPIAAETIRSWVAQGRANGLTPVLPEGAAQWTILGACAEFADLFPVGTGVAGSGAAASATSSKTSGLAISSLVLGCLGFLSCGLASLAGLPLGIVAMVKIKKSEGRLTGWGLALAGTILSGVSLLILPLYAAMLLPALAKAKQKAQAINCVNNLKQLGLAVRLYSADNNDKYPATNWCDTIINEAGSARIYVCPGAPSLASGYAFNSKILGSEDGKIDPATVMIFESDAGWNASGGKELMITRPRHGTTFNVVLADGSAQQLTAAKVAMLKWDPNPASSQP